MEGLGVSKELPQHVLGRRVRPIGNVFLAFYEEADLGHDKVWDNWRLEGPSFVWHFRGKPHVHIWINVADDPGVELNAYQDSIM